MFRNRNNAQKPDEDFISRFQQTFNDVVPRRESDGQNAGTHDFMDSNRLMGHHDIKMEDSNVKFPNERTPRNLQDLNISPSWMDPNSLHMISLAGQHSGLYTPNSGGLGPIFHNQAGDLHTPTLGMNMMTPLSLSNPAMHQQAHPQTLDHFNPQFLGHNMPEVNPYLQSASFAPSTFVHRDSTFDAMDESGDASSLNEIAPDSASNVTASTDFPMADHGMAYARGEKFRYNVALRATTAMVKSSREVPISYLNKGQAYNLTVTDTSPPMINSEPIRYRTFVRVSFEEEEQRLKPATCWQLWKEGRGLNEAHQRGGKLQAVEFVNPLQGSNESPAHRQIQVEQMSFDGFCVTWTANPSTGSSDCNIPVRFNFLSTDFSHSKGVKGIPVRLCAKTELLAPGNEMGALREPEVCYCKVKLFRDHGAERKLANDIAHVKKTIEKLKQQISQAESGGGYGKRKRGNNASNIKGPDRSKASKHKRSWSFGSEDGSTEKMSLEDDLQAKLAMMQDMFSSPRSVSLLALRGEEGDDPDLHPVRLPSEGDFATESLGHNTSASHSMESLILSPSLSHASSPRMQARLAGSKDPTAVPRVASDARVSTGFIEAVDIDPTYRPPSERPPKPIACFYVRFSGNEQHPQDYYRAIYLTERSVRDLMKKISEKHRIDPKRIVRVLHVNEKGLRIMVDDDVVRELPEGQDMIADIYETPSAPSSDDTPGLPMEIKLTY
ncbi:hypothetical protein N7492_008415 [Penicillium capsulatum]|uniref:Grh/CP2 DB domain-containing protein n=1 Tax=Penicillium capsulatum TaxID=69766 RepID=A0A9W9HRK1_9EURO|nr:hypothetical protein N7492_008415 [Penicillium capsulatum]KAJ6105817.1 hypothetical protein N7512_009334 [Penicillium capsulatum]